MQSTVSAINTKFLHKHNFFKIIIDYYSKLGHLVYIQFILSKFELINKMIYINNYDYEPLANHNILNSN